MIKGVFDIGVVSLLTFMYIEAMNDNVGHVLDNNAWLSRDVDVVFFIGECGYTRIGICGSKALHAFSFEGLRNLSSL